jgi:hypothetical protein
MVGQAALTQVAKQGREVGDIADLPTKRVGADVLLEDGTHPLERGLTCLLTPVGLRDPTGVRAADVIPQDRHATAISLPAQTLEDLLSAI